MRRTFCFCAGFLWLVVVARSQEPAVYSCICGGGLCTTSLVLYPDNSYVYEHGCEASSHLSFGTWIKRKDTIKFEPVDPKTFTVIKTISSTTVPGDSIWITVLDKNGINMTAKISMGLEIAGRGSYMFSNDSTGNRKFVYKRNGGRIVLRTLNKLLGQKVEIPTDTANQFIITLALSTNWVWSTHADWSPTGPFKTIKKGDSLLSITPRFAGIFELKK